jgi:hypothetical protein
VSLRGFSTINVWADDVAAVAAWYAEFMGVEPYDVLASTKPA